jgi:DMSO reductase family type II enzyme heme b subunit
MKKSVDLIAAPTAAQPGGYVPKAYAERSTPAIRSATLEAERSPEGWRIRLAWSCPEAVRDISGDTDHFVDAAALAVPAVPDAPWVSMGAPGKAVEGALWRADRPGLLQFRAEGLGTVERDAPPAHWKVTAGWENGAWSVAFDLTPWPQLDQGAQLGFAIWRGTAADRGGLKSISPGWLALTP